MEGVIETVGEASRDYLQKLRRSLAKEGDDRLARALTEYETLRIVLEWSTSWAAAILITLFAWSLFHAQGRSCLVVALVGALAAILHHALAEWLSRHYNRRFYDAVPENLRWCFRRTA